MSALDEGGIWCGTCYRSRIHRTGPDSCTCPREAPQPTTSPVTDDEARKAARADNALGLGSLHAAYVQVLTEFREARGYWADLDETDLNRTAALRVKFRHQQMPAVEAWRRILTADLTTHRRKAHR